MKGPIPQVVLAALFACSLCLPALAQAQDSLPQNVRDDAELVVRVFTGMAKVIEGSKGDCAKMGNALEKWAAGNAADIDAMQQAIERLQQLPTEQNAQMETEFGPRMHVVEEALVNFVDCAMEPKVTQTLEKLIPAMSTKDDEDGNKFE